MRGLWFACVVGGGLAIFGCAPSGPKTYEVSGNVTFDGEPLPKGGIIFQPTDKSLSPQGGTIVDGAYKLRTASGSYRVEITASRRVPGQKKAARPSEELFEQYLPANYNKQTILTADVAESKNQLDFPLTSR